MLIQQNYSTNNYNYNSNQSVKPQIHVGFKGHANVDRAIFRKIPTLVQQTAFDRELQTKMFVKDYLKTNFSDLPKIKIVSAGCSTGEEGVAMSMLLYDMKNKVEILGIDLGKKAIKQAKSRKYVLEVPRKESNLLEYFNSIADSPYTDTFLVTKDYSGLSANQRYLASLFNEFFEPKARKVRPPLNEMLHNQVSLNMGMEPLLLDRYEYKLKDGMAENCRFQQGDVRDIDKILGDEKVCAISFCNALYHLTVTDPTSSARIPRWNSEEIVESLMTKFKNSLYDNGLVIFGENEEPQMGDALTVPKVMKKLGFLPLNKTADHSANVWEKG